MPILDAFGKPSLGLTDIAWPLTLPAYPSPSSCVLRMSDQVAVMQSPFTFTRQVQQWGANRIAFDVTYPPMDADQARAWIAAFAALRGRAGTFWFSDMSQPIPRGVVNGTPVVDGGSQAGRTLNVKGWEVGIPLQLRSGDWIQVGKRMYLNLVDVDSDANGKTSLSIWPALRESPADGDQVVVFGAKGLFALTSNERTASVDNALKYGIQFSCEEAL